MPFVKLDCGILNSTLWFEKDVRDVFITALLMAEPMEFDKAIPQIAVDSLEYTGWEAPPGWYGYVPAAGVSIASRAGLEKDAGIEALRRLGAPESSSRTPDFEGRRMIRIDGGYLILNYMKYRERDYTTAERSKRYRERLAKKAASRRDSVTSRRDITQAEAEAEVQAEAKDGGVPPPAPPPLREAVQAPGALAGTLPRDHLTHAWCGSRFCVTANTWAKLVRQWGGGQIELVNWLSDVDASLHGKPYGGAVWLMREFESWLAHTGRVTQTEAKPRKKSDAEAWLERQQAKGEA